MSKETTNNTSKLSNDSKDDSQQVSLHKSLNLYIRQKDLTKFNRLFERYAQSTGNFNFSSSRPSFFSLGVNFLTYFFKKANLLIDAPGGFPDFISRPGRRVATDRTVSTDKKTHLSLKIPAEDYDSYIDLIYSFLKQKNDVHNMRYSPAYFFPDFLKLLQKNFRSFCSWGKKNDPGRN